MPTGLRHENEALRPYVPRVLIEWVRSGDQRRARELGGTLAFVDIAGFTKLTERLARQGKVGAEELNDLLDACFTRLIDLATRDGADLVKWGGDAVLLLFKGDEHGPRACRAAFEMRRALREMGRVRCSVGYVSLRMSVGIHSGTFQFYFVGGDHLELVIAGPAATHTVLMESTASAGEILLSSATASLLESRVVGRPKGDGFLLRALPDIPHPPSLPPPDGAALDLARCVPLGLREYLRGRSHEAEHRHVAVAFLEFTCTDDLVERAGPDQVAVALDASIRTVQEEARSHAVTFFETDISGNGVKVLLVAGAPSSSGNDEEGMLLALRSIMDRAGALPLRIGVNSGRVFSSDFGPPYRRSYSIRGDAVNLAARLMGRAAEGQVLVTDAVLTRSRTSFEAHELPPFTVKGKAHPVKAHSLGTAGRRRLAEHDASALVGREQEMAVLLAALESAIGRRGRIVEVVGEPGMGKSRLVEELVSHVDGVTVLIARGEMYEASSPYQPFRGMLRELLGIGSDQDPVGATKRLRDRVEANAPHLLPWLPLLGIPMDIEIPLTPETAQLDENFRQQQLEAVTEELLEWTLPTPTVFVFDDAHWMDAASASLIRRIAARTTRLPWLVLLTRREVDGGFTLSEEDGAVTLSLKPLDPGDATVLLEASTEMFPIPRHELAALAERSGGNPLFLRELVAVARSEGFEDVVPDSVEELMTAEIDRLGADDRALLRHAAVLGVTFSLSVLADMLGRTDLRSEESIWQRLADFVREEEPGTFRFRHALLRDAAYEGLPYRRRRELHAAAGDAITRTSSGFADEQADLLSLHFFNAHRYEDAWRYARIAADRARSKYALVEAGRLYRRALDAARNVAGIPAPEIADVHEARGDLLDRLGAYGEAADSYRAARGLVGDDPLAESKLYLKEAWISERLGRYTQGLRWVTRGRRALDGVEGIEAGKQRARLAAWYAAIRQGQGRYVAVLAWCRRAIEEAEASGEREALAQAYFIMDWALVDLGELEQATNSPRALEIYRELGNLGSAATVLNNMGMFAYFRGRWNEAIELYQQGHDLRLKIGDTVDAAMGPMNIGEILSDQGRLEEAEAMFRDVLRVWTAAGRKEFIALTTSDLARVASRSGGCSKAMDLFGDALRMFEEIGDDGEVLETEARIAECLMLEGAVTRALAACDASLKRARAIGGVPPQLPMLNRVKGWSLMQAGRLEDAGRAFEESLEAARSRQADFEISLSLHAKAALARSTGTRDEDAERESRSLFERLGVVRVPGIPPMAAALMDAREPAPSRAGAESVSDP